MTLTKRLRLQLDLNRREENTLLLIIPTQKGVQRREKEKYTRKQ